MAVNNSTILGKIWLSGTNDYQQRVPNPTQGQISSTMRALFSPNNNNLYNQFIDSFINLIGQQRVHQSIWENPLTPFKGNRLLYGSTIQEAAPKWIKAHAYDDTAEDLLKMERPEFAVWYHSMNRQDKYPITVNRQEVMTAFRDEYGLNRLINSIMNVPINSDNYDEYLCMIELIAEYEHNWGFYKYQTDKPVDEATGKAFLTPLRAFANKLSFPSTLYNASDLSVPVFAKPSELILIVDADTDASLDVNTLSSVFQLDLADIKYRKVVIPEFPIANAYALLTTEDFFVVNDIVYETNSFYDPNTLNTKYILHHWEIVSASPFVPAILFTTDEGTTIETVTQSVTSLNIAADETNAVPGDMVQLTLTLNGTLTPDGYPEDLEIAPDAAVFAVAGTRGSEGITLNTRTYVDRLGRLHIQKGGLKENDKITVTAISTYINPSGETQEYKATVDVTISQDSKTSTNTYTIKDTDEKKPIPGVPNEK